MDTRKQIIEIITNILKKEGLQEFLEANSNLDDIGLNSLIFINIVVELENKFNISFDDEKLDYKSFANLDELIRYVDLLKYGG